MSTSTSSTSTSPIYFFRETESPYGFLSQWYPSPFTSPTSDPSITYQTAEQYMMYQKALLFSDTSIASKILASKSPKAQKALGRKVAGFDGQKWLEYREKIVEDGNWNKFMNSSFKTEGEGGGGGGKEKEEEDIRKRLLDTGDRELVEASPFDRIWGVGFAAVDAKRNREQWGENLMGKAIMRVRERIREESKR
ncbi:MAG: hypothetical protein M1812_000371 [Candelaria pacifica]|nr:MAG: hypothetical protein M1812_000371 [Candelaria pacifica]